MKIKRLLQILIPLILFSETYADWEKLESYIEYKEVMRSYSGEKNRSAKFHIFRLKQSGLKFSIKSFHNLQKDEKVSVSALRRENNFLIVLTGGYYDPDFRKPVGLLIEKKKVVFEISTKLSGVVWLKDNHLYLSPTAGFDFKKNKPDFAIQGYPRIVDPVNKPGIHNQSNIFAQRAAVCTKGDYVFLIITDRKFDGVSLYELSMIAQKSESDGGLNSDIAINLDGGPAPGISVAPELNSLNIQEGWQVPNAIVVEKR